MAVRTNWRALLGRRFLWRQRQTCHSPNALHCCSSLLAVRGSCPSNYPPPPPPSSPSSFSSSSSSSSALLPPPPPFGSSS
eukprot:5189819-Pyramimonas_sp.AAC.1